MVLLSHILAFPTNEQIGYVENHTCVHISDTINFILIHISLC